VKTNKPLLKITIILVVILVGVLLRLGAAIYMGDSIPSDKDETSYSELAERLSQGYGYSFDQQWYPGFVHAGAPTSHWSFLYTGFVATIYSLFGPHPLIVRFFSALISGILMPLMLYRLARRTWPEKEQIALLTAALGAIYAYFILFGAMIQTEAFFIITVLWSLERSLALLHNFESSDVTRLNSIILVLGLGVSLGMATLLRQSILPWVVISFVLLLFAGWIHHQLRKAFLSLFFAGLILLAFILPFTIRKYQVYGDFLLLNSNAGYAMYSAQHPMHGTNFQAFAAAPLPDDIDPLPQNEAQWDRALMARGFQFILEEPGRYALLSLSRIADYFMFWPARETSAINNIGRILSFAIFLPIMLYGLWLSFPDWRRYWLLYVFIAFYSFMHILTWAMIRYRLPVDAVLLLFAALALTDLYHRLPARWQPTSTFTHRVGRRTAVD
jgi:hypothetical protein